MRIYIIGHALADSRNPEKEMTDLVKANSLEDALDRWASKNCFTSGRFYKIRNHKYANSCDVGWVFHVRLLSKELENRILPDIRVLLDRAGVFYQKIFLKTEIFR